jgi:hypothetical protein
MVYCPRRRIRDDVCLGGDSNGRSKMVTCHDEEAGLTITTYPEEEGCPARQRGQ